MANELISVIIPTYKREPELLNRAIDSVLSQDYSNIEVVVVDDNAKWPEYRKKVITLMEEYTKDKRVSFIQNEENLGGGGSRNQGVNVSRGEYLAFCDDDDWFMPGKLTKQFSRLKESGASLCYCWGQGINNKGDVVWENRKGKEGNLLIEAMTECIANTSLIMILRSEFEAIGGFELVPCKQDVLLELKLAANGGQFVCVHEILLNYGCEDDSFERLSNVSPKTVTGMLTVWEYARKHYDKLTREQIRFVESNTAFKLCELTRKLNDRKAYFQYLKIGLKNAPFSKRAFKGVVKGLIW